MSEPVLILNQISKHYGGRAAVSRIDFSLNAGECVGLAGHNGAGKSTIIKLILGLIRADGGSLHLFGQEVSDSRSTAVRNRIGYLPETAALHPALTGRETLDFYAKLKRCPLSRNAGLLARVGIAQAADKRVGTYSKGMRQRLALAQALLGEPKLLLLDEPTTGLDPASRQMFYQIIGELKAEGAAVLLSTHALAELDGHADRIVVMKNGSKVADGKLRELHRQSGLPVRMEVLLYREAELPPPWRQLSERLYGTSCPPERQTEYLRLLGAWDNIERLDIHAPTLDEVYAGFLQREDA